MNANRQIFQMKLDLLHVFVLQKLDRLEINFLFILHEPNRYLAAFLCLIFQVDETASTVNKHVNNVDSVQN